jgi:5-methylcytosine-specific restriction endonuclease McrA
MASKRKKLVREEFRRNVLAHDGNKCRTCESTEDLVAHHITDRTEMPNGGYVPENGITLCPGCHIKAERFHETGGEEWHEGFHPDDLYGLVGSTKEAAYLASKRLRF